jgi:hypothetical protein
MHNLIVVAVQRIQGIMNGEDPFKPPPIPNQSSSLPSGVNIQ